MGIYDREYYRDETRGSGWLSGVAPACKAIIAINVALFLAQWVFRGLDLEAYFAASSTDIFERGRVWQLLTAAFLHDPHNVWHVLWNMLFLWFVGRDMESMYGTREFTFLYLAAAIFSTFCWALVNYVGPSQGAGIMLGASGAVTAVVMLYTLYYPNREILLFFILPVPMWLLLVIYLGSDLLMLVQELQGGPGMGTAFAAHLAGALYGFLYKKSDLRWTRLLGTARLRRPRLRVVSPERTPPPRPAPTHASAASGPKHAATTVVPEEQLADRLDEVLAKIAREGREALTEDEHRILQEASRQARNRRRDRV